MTEKKARLGRGLGAIFGEDVNSILEDIQKGQHEQFGGTQAEISLEQIRMNPYQPRTHFDQDKINELAQSIVAHGVFTPILVRPTKHGYELIAGERRVRAANEAKLTTIPAIVMEFTDEEMMEISLIENIQREDLNVIEEASAYQKMMEYFKYTQEEVAKRVGKSREHVANIVRLLKLPQEVRNMVADGKLSMGHVRPLITLDSQAAIIEAAQKTVNLGLSVRAVEAMVKKPTKKAKKESDLSVYQYAKSLLQSKVQSKVTIDHQKIVIQFKGTQDLNRILEVLGIVEEEGS